MISLNRFSHPNSSWWLAILLGGIWLVGFVWVGMQRGEVKEACKRFAFDRVAESASFRLSARDEFPGWILKAFRVDEDSMEKKLLRFLDLSEKYELLPDASRVKWAVPLVQLGNHERARGVLPTEAYGSRDLEQRRQLMAAYAAEKELPEELSEWANFQCEAGYSELPEWFALHRGGHEATIQWMKEVGRKLLIRGMFSRSLMVIGLVFGVIAIFCLLFRPSLFPASIPESPVFGQWNGSYVLRQFFIAELLASVVVIGLAFVPIAPEMSDIQMAVLHLLYLALPAVFLAGTLAPNLGISWRLFFKSGRGWNYRKMVVLGLAFVGVFLIIALLADWAVGRPFVIGDVIIPNYLDSKARVIWIAIGATIVAPFCEEFVFRGCSMRRHS